MRQDPSDETPKLSATTAIGLAIAQILKIFEIQPFKIEHGSRVAIPIDSLSPEVLAQLGIQFLITPFNETTASSPNTAHAANTPVPIEEIIKPLLETEPKTETSSKTIRAILTLAHHYLLERSNIDQLDALFTKLHNGNLNPSKQTTLYYLLNNEEVDCALHAAISCEEWDTLNPALTTQKPNTVLYTVCETTLLHNDLFRHRLFLQEREKQHRHETDCINAPIGDLVLSIVDLYSSCQLTVTVSPSNDKSASLSLDVEENMRLVRTVSRLLQPENAILKQPCLSDKTKGAIENCIKDRLLTIQYDFTNRLKQLKCLELWLAAMAFEALLWTDLYLSKFVNEETNNDLNINPDFSQLNQDFFSLFRNREEDLHLLSQHGFPPLINSLFCLNAILFSLDLNSPTLSKKTIKTAKAFLKLANQNFSTASKTRYFYGPGQHRPQNFDFFSGSKQGYAYLLASVKSNIDDLDQKSRGPIFAKQ